MRRRMRVRRRWASLAILGISASVLLAIVRASEGHAEARLPLGTFRAARALGFNPYTLTTKVSESKSAKTGDSGKSEKLGTGGKPAVFDRSSQDSVSLRRLVKPRKPLRPAGSLQRQALLVPGRLPRVSPTTP